MINFEVKKKDNIIDCFENAIFNNNVNKNSQNINQDNKDRGGILLQHGNNVGINNNFNNKYKQSNKNQVKIQQNKLIQKIKIAMILIGLIEVLYKNL